MGSEQNIYTLWKKKNFYRIIYFKHKIVGISITSLILINWCTVCYDNIILNHWFYIYRGLGQFLDYEFTNQTIWFMWF